MLIVGSTILVRWAFIRASSASTTSGIHVRIYNPSGVLVEDKAPEVIFEMVGRPGLLALATFTPDVRGTWKISILLGSDVLHTSNYKVHRSDTTAFTQVWTKHYEDQLSLIN